MVEVTLSGWPFQERITPSEVADPSRPLPKTLTYALGPKLAWASAMRIALCSNSVQELKRPLDVPEK